MEADADGEPSHWQNEVYRMLRQQGVTQFAAAASSVEVPRLSVFQISSVPLPIWSGGALRRWRMRFFPVCR
jgi:hypothetical protein